MIGNFPKTNNIFGNHLNFLRCFYHRIIDKNVRGIARDNSSFNGMIQRKVRYLFFILYLVRLKKDVFESYIALITVRIYDFC